MEIVNIWKTSRIIEPVEVTVSGVYGKTHAEVADFAVDAAGERGRNFGTKVTITHNIAVVTIYRD